MAFDRPYAAGRDLRNLELRARPSSEGEAPPPSRQRIDTPVRPSEELRLRAARLLLAARSVNHPYVDKWGHYTYMQHWVPAQRVCS